MTWRTKKLKKKKPADAMDTWVTVRLPPDEAAYLEKLQLLYQTYEGEPVPRYTVVVTALRLLEQTLERKLRLRRQA